MQSLRPTPSITGFAPLFKRWRQMHSLRPTPSITGFAPLLKKWKNKIDFKSHI
jgi:hypothetical protein